ASEEGQDRRIPITPLLRPDNIRTAPQYEALGSFVETRVIGEVEGAVASGFYTVDGVRVGIREPAPSLGTEDLPDWEPRDGPGGDAPVEGDGSERADAGPFAGVRVLDFGVAGAAPEMARLLGEYGAEVIRVETPKRPDLFRQLGGPSLMSAVFASSNRSKDSFGVDLDDPEGRRLVLELAAGSDVVVENLPPGTMERWGLGPDDLLESNPEMLVISSQTMGRRGPWTHWRGYGANNQPVGGMTYLWTHPEAPEPVAANVAFPDHVVGRLGAVMAAAHLLARRRQGISGARVEIVQAEVCLNVLADLFLADSVGTTVKPVGNRSSLGAPWGVYRCAGLERWCVVCCRNDADWQGLVAAMGSPEWAVDDRFATDSSRREHRDELDRCLGEWTQGLTDVEVAERCQAHDVPAGPMLYLGDQPHDPHLAERGYVRRIHQPGLGEMYLEGAAFRGGGLGFPRTEPAPGLGEHTRRVASERLGLDHDEVERLIAAGTLYEPTTEE
ncbi:MAG: CaiB/BaiF CoA transferase family protein, partial [Actinomycetota bacterium]